MESVPLYYLTLVEPKEEPLFPIKKKKKKKKSKKETRPAADPSNTSVPEETSIQVLPFPKKTSPKLIEVTVQCQPVAKFSLKIDCESRIEEAMNEIQEIVHNRFNTDINILRLLLDDGSVSKGIPADYQVGEMLKDGDEVSVEFTLSGQVDATPTPPSKAVSTEESDHIGGYICPFQFSGPTANRDLKLHLAHMKQIPARLPKSLRGETIRCPLYFFNAEDASAHIQSSTAADRVPDLTTFWERNEADLFEVIDESERREQLKRDKKKKTKERSRIIEKTIKEKKRQREQRRKQKEMEDKDREKQLSIEADKLRKHREVYRWVRSSIVDKIVKAVNLHIEQQQQQKRDQATQDLFTHFDAIQEPLFPTTHRNKKKKKKKVPPAQDAPPPAPLHLPPTPLPKVDVHLPDRTMSPPPTKPRDNVKPYSSGISRTLHQEIQEYATAIQLIVTSQSKRVEDTIHKVRSVVESVWPHASVELYGSHSTSLCIPSSDLDLVVMGTAGPSDLGLLAKHLRTQPWIQNLITIETAKVPVIKLVSDDGVPTDITFDGLDSNSPAFCTSEGLLAHHEGLTAKELIRSFLSKMPEIIPLTLALKQILSERGLNNAYTGGLSSYPLVIMVISFLQQCEQSRGNLGELLLDFLELYGKNFDFTATGISISGNGSHFSLKSVGMTAASMVIIDPFNPTNNIAASVIGMPRIKIIFADVYNTLVAPFFHSYTPASLLGRVLKDDAINKKVKEIRAQKIR
eukprot:TRINITY_DN7358_c0_g1_i1.p1 TRINITY_DN7358_c0_g1~~TRINITY_DN7358_c0_g1_i1.p1  ORF type:complete len:744 (+),score=219.44 TRINITY_DN7358_c0_g1_i1:129-2360(+)